MLPCLSQLLSTAVLKLQGAVAVGKHVTVSGGIQPPSPRQQQLLLARIWKGRAEKPLPFPVSLSFQVCSCSQSRFPLSFNFQILSEEEQSCRRRFWQQSWRTGSPFRFLLKEAKVGCRRRADAGTSVPDGWGSVLLSGIVYEFSLHFQAPGIWGERVCAKMRQTCQTKSPPAPRFHENETVPTPTSIPSKQQETRKGSSTQFAGPSSPQETSSALSSRDSSTVCKAVGVNGRYWPSG